MSINILLNTQNNILYQLPPGKPDPTHKFGVEPDLRPRVFQKKQLSISCAYYAFNRIRDRIGTHPENNQFKRYIEKCCSIRQRKLSETFDQHLKSGFTDNNKFEMENLNINCEFINSFDIDLNLYYSNFCEGPLIGTTLEDLYYRAPLDVKSKVIEILSNNIMADQFGLERTTWSPDQQIEALIHVLKNRGPMAAQGLLGQNSYSVLPKIMEKICGINIYGWSKGSYQAHHSEIMRKSIRHVVVIIGAAKSEGSEEVVYFINPNDCSDPKDKTSQKIYVISYQNFRDNISDSNGRLYNRAKVAPLPSYVEQLNPKAKWGYHGTRRQIRAVKRALHDYDQKIITLSIIPGSSDLCDSK